MKTYFSVYFHQRFFIAGTTVVILLITGYILPVFFTVGKIMLTIWLLITFFDLLRLYGIRAGLDGSRQVPELLSNGDQNPVRLKISSAYRYRVELEIIDELPFQLQWRDFMIKTQIAAGHDKKLAYQVKPLTRGIYEFGRINVFASSPIGLVKRKFQLGESCAAKVYPSVIQMRQQEFLAISSVLIAPGQKRVRKYGRSLEFDQIKEYIPGDDFRTINWKATARRREVMVNVYQEEKAQPVYAIIDKGRSMKLPFAGMTLLDYAINSALSFCNIALRKQDKAGLITFQHQLGTMIPASRRPRQLQLLLEALYHQKTSFKESDFASVFSAIVQKVPTRSLLLIYTNFESAANLDGPLPYLVKLARRHLVVVIFFENTELSALLNQEAKDVESVYRQAVAEKFNHEKYLIVQKLRNHGIHTVLTKPENLGTTVINKYLEIKSRQLL